MDKLDTDSFSRELEGCIRKGVKSLLSDFSSRYDMLEQTHLQIMQLPSVVFEMNKRVRTGEPVCIPESVEGATDDVPKSATNKVNPEENVTEWNAKCTLLENEIANKVDRESVEKMAAQVEKMAAQVQTLYGHVEQNYTHVQQTFSSLSSKLDKFTPNTSEIAALTDRCARLEEQLEKLLSSPPPKRPDHPNIVLHMETDTKVVEEEVEVEVEVEEEVEEEEEEEDEIDTETEEEEEDVTSPPAPVPAAVVPVKKVEPVQEEEEEEEEEELEEVEIEDVTYYSNDTENGKLYAKDGEDEVGEEVGYFKDGEVFFYADEK